MKPARLLPLLYLGTAHVSLALACLVTALSPYAVAGFFYNPWMVGVVHLVTIGWIGLSIFGAIYIVGPLALRMDMPRYRADYLAYASVVTGLAGMVSHFWILEYSGMAWSAGMTAAGMLYMTVRIAIQVRRAKVSPAVKLHVILACVNFWIAAGMGLLIAIDRVVDVLPESGLSEVFAHAHLAALGWVVMMVVGVAYRLLPMTFPSRMPSGRSLYASALLLETGVLGLFVTLLTGSRWMQLFGLVIVMGLAAFAGHVAWMLRHPVPKPVAAHRIEFGLLHAASAGLCLAGAAAIGLMLLILPISMNSLRAAGAYGVLGLIGFLGQMIIAMEARLLPMVTWFWASGTEREPPPSPHAMRNRPLQAIVLAGWTIGVPALAAGMSFYSPQLVSLGAWSLFVGIAVATIDNVSVVRASFRATVSGR